MRYFPQDIGTFGSNHLPSLSFLRDVTRKNVLLAALFSFYVCRLTGCFPQKRASCSSGMPSISIISQRCRGSIQTPNLENMAYQLLRWYLHGSGPHVHLADLIKRWKVEPDPWLFLTRMTSGTKHKTFFILLYHGEEASFGI